MLGPLGVRDSWWLSRGWVVGVGVGMGCCLGRSAEDCLQDSFGGLSGGLAISGAIWEDCLEGWLSLGLAGECYLTSPAFVCSGARTSEGS